MFLAIYRPEVTSDGNLYPSFPKDKIKRIEAPFIDSKKSIDQILSDFIQTKLINEKSSGIIIPLSLTQDYTNFTGVRLGIHIRYSDYQGLERDIPIIFIGEETINEICKINPIGFFLFTESVYLAKEKSEDIRALIQKNFSPTNLDYIENILTKIIIPEAPDFFDNRHAIANDWSLILLDRLSGHSILEREEKIAETKANLYIKWLLTKGSLSFSKIQQTNKKFILKGIKKKKVLIIEDEWEKGWLELYNAIFNNGHVDGAEVKYIEIDKTDNTESILKKVDDELVKDWDLFFLDIRLIDNDHNEALDFKEYSGFKVLEKIKENNCGNQVILISASNKQWIYDYGRNIGADEVFVKPSLHDRPDLDRIMDSLNESIKSCLNRYYLKYFFNVIKEIKSNFKVSHLKLESDHLNDVYAFEKELIYRLGLFAELISKPVYSNNNHLRFAFLELFILFENYCKQSFICQDSYGKFFVIDKGGSDLVIWEPDQTIPGNTKIRLGIDKNKYDFQTSESQETVVSVRKRETLESLKLETHKIKLSNLLKRVAILSFRHEVDDNCVAEFLEINYLRNNLAGHETGNIKREKGNLLREIELKDIWNMIEILKLCLINADKSKLVLKKTI